MPPSTSKKVVLYRWERQPAEGIVEPSSYLQDDRLQWLTPDGRFQTCLLIDCKALCFVSEVGRFDLFLEHNLFERRPRAPGLWARFAFRDGAQLEGILSHNLLEWPAMGFLVTPPQARASRQRVFIPRLALASTELRGVIGASKMAAAKGEPKSERGTRQLNIFES